MKQAAFAMPDEYVGPRNWAIQSSIIFDGFFSVGLLRYTENYSTGIFASSSINDAPNKTQVVTPGWFGGPRFRIYDGTFLAFGVDVFAQLGRILGEQIDGSYGLGPYISIEQYLTPNLILAAWIHPYFFDHQQRANVATDVNRIFNSGGFGLSYLFA